MIIRNKLKLGFLIAILSVPMLPAEIVLAGEEQRAPPEARTSGTLGTQVMRAITEIQELMTPEDPEDEPDLVRAKEELDDLYERRFERMNDFEKQTTLNFYTNYWLTVENYPEAIRTFEQLLTIETLREDTRMRTLKSLGQLYAAEEDWENSIRNYELWRDASLEEDHIVYRGLSYAHYQLEQFSEALPHWVAYMELLLSRGEPLGRDDYAYLNGIYFTLEDFDNALDLTKTMIVLFDDPIDWRNLMAIYSGLDNEDRRIQALNLAYLKGYFEDDSEFLNLGQSMAGIDAPLTGVKIIKDGLDQSILEPTEDNLTVYSQMFLIGSDYANALEPARLLAEASETGDGYDSLGYVQYVLRQYEDAAESFQQALDKGDLSDRGDTLLFLARSLIEMEDFEGAMAATREAADIGDESGQRSASTYLRYIESTQTRFDALARARSEAAAFYQPYPPLE